MALSRIVIRDIRRLTLKTSNTGRALAKHLIDLQKALKKELVAQGHVGSGKLRDSISVNFPKTTSGLFEFKGEIEALEYGLKLNNEQSPKSISAKKILDWIESKGSNFKPTTPEMPKKLIAQYIARSISEEGIPTVIVDAPIKLSAYGYTKNGRRLGWINIPYNRKKINIDKKIVPAIIEDVISVIDDLLTKLASRYKDIKYEK